MKLCWYYAIFVMFPSYMLVLLAWGTEKNVVEEDTITCPSGRLKVTCGYNDRRIFKGCDGKMNGFLTGDEMCYIDLNKTVGMCCSPSEFCKVTSMKSYYSLPISLPLDKLVRHKWDPILSSKGFYSEPGTGSACPLPYSFVTRTFQKDFPVDFTVNTKTRLKKCIANKDCADGQYCSPAYNSATKQSSTPKFCYKAVLHSTKELLPYVPRGKDEIGIRSCDEHFTCPPDTNCLLGLCVTAINAPPCPNAGNHCHADTDCDGSSKYKSDQFKSICQRMYDDVKICCYEPRTCALGDMKLPKKNCNETSDCSSDGSSWCENRKGHCCTDESETSWLCPDEATPLFNEPPCVGSNASDIYSGICEYDPKAKCYWGHCCPALEKNGSSYMIAKWSYSTMVTCPNGVVVRLPFVYSYCHEGRITIFGRDAIEKDFSSYKQCSVHSDCSEDNSFVCVSKGVEKRCIRNIYSSGKAETEIGKVIEHSSSSSSEKSSPPYGYIVVGCVLGLFVVVGLCSYIHKKSKQSAMDGMKKGKKQKGKKTKKVLDSLEKQILSEGERIKRKQIPKESVEGLEKKYATWTEIKKLFEGDGTLTSVIISVKEQISSTNVNGPNVVMSVIVVNQLKEMVITKTVSTGITNPIQKRNY